MSLEKLFGAYAPYVVAVVSIAIVLVIRLLLQHFFGIGTPFLMWIMPIGLAAWYGGLLPGILATFLSGVLSEIFFLDTVHPIFNPEAFWEVWIFFIGGLFLSFLFEDRRRDTIIGSINALRYQSMIDNTDDAILTKTLDGIVTTWNPGAERLYGYRKSEMLGESITKIIPDEASDDLNRIIDMVARGEQLTHYETKRRRADGSLIDVSVNASPVKTPVGTIVGVAVTARDITESKRVQQQLTDALILYTQIERTATDIILTMGEDSIIQSVNPAIYDILGWKPDELVGNNLSMIQPPAFRNGHVAGMKRFVETGEKSLNWRLVEVEAQHKDGHVIPVGISFSSFEKDGKKVFTGIIRDISERVNFIRDLEETKKYYKDLVDLSPEPAAVHSGGKVVYANQATLELLGYSREEIIGMSILDVVHPSSQAFAIDRVNRAYNDGDKLPLAEELFVRKDGSTVIVEIASMPVTWEGLPAMHVVCRDTTERKKTERELRESEQRYRLVTETVEDLIIFTDMSGNIVYINEPAHRKSLGYEPGEMIGHKLQEFIDPQREDSEVDVMKTLLTGEVITASPTKLKHKNGQWINCRGSNALVFNDNNTPINFIATYRPR